MSAKKVSSHERQLNLAMQLKTFTQGLSAEEIFNQVHGFMDQDTDPKTKKQRLLRDIRALEELNYEIECSSESEGYKYRIVNAPDSFEISLTPAETLILELAQSGWEDTVLKNAFKAVKTKVNSVSDTLINPSRSARAINKRNVQNLAAVLVAIREKTAISFQYDSLASGAADRLVLPLQGSFQDSGWYFKAWEPASELVKTYKIERILGKVNSDKTKITLPVAVTEKTSNANDDTTEVSVTIKYRQHSKFAKSLINYQVSSEPEAIADKPGWLMVQVLLNPSYAFISQVIMNFADVVVIEPAELVAKIKARLGDLPNAEVK